MGAFFIALCLGLTWGLGRLFIGSRPFKCRVLLTLPILYVSLALIFLYSSTLSERALGYAFGVIVLIGLTWATAFKEKVLPLYSPILFLGLYIGGWLAVLFLNAGDSFVGSSALMIALSLYLWRVLRRQVPFERYLGYLMLQLVTAILFFYPSYVRAWPIFFNPNGELGFRLTPSDVLGLAAVSSFLPLPFLTFCYLIFLNRPTVEKWEDYQRRIGSEDGYIMKNLYSREPINRVDLVILLSFLFLALGSTLVLKADPYLVLSLYTCALLVWKDGKFTPGTLTN